MKKTLFALIAVLALGLLAVPAMAKVTIKVANSGPDNPDNRTVKAAKIFTDYVADKTNGEVEIVFYHASQLGAELEALEGVQMGTIEMATLSGGPVPSFFKPVMVYDIPYLFSSNAAAWAFAESDFAKKFENEFQNATGVRILAITENGFRHFTNKDKPIKTPADIKGLKVRTMQNPAHMAMVSAMGGDPTPIPFSELYMALQQGVVDAMECPIALIHDMKFYEVQDYMVLDGHLYNPLFVFVNNDFFENKLTPEQQQAVIEGAELFAMAHDGFNQEANVTALADLEAQGMHIYKPTPEEIAQFRAIAQPAGLEFVRKEAGDQWVDEALAAAAAAEEQVAGQEQTMVDEYIKKSNEALAKTN